MGLENHIDTLFWDVIDTGGWGSQLEDSDVER